MQVLLEVEAPNGTAMHVSLHHECVKEILMRPLCSPEIKLLKGQFQPLNLLSGFMFGDVISSFTDPSIVVMVSARGLHQN